jgi:hypothetical protein
MGSITYLLSDTGTDSVVPNKVLKMPGIPRPQPPHPDGAAAVDLLEGVRPSGGVLLPETEYPGLGGPAPVLPQSRDFPADGGVMG